MATGRADEAVRPSQPFQVVEAVRISREPSPKLPKGLRVVDAGEGSLHPSGIRQVRLNGYPRRRLCRLAAGALAGAPTDPERLLAANLGGRAARPGIAHGPPPFDAAG